MANNKNKQSEGNVVYTHPDWVDRTIAIARQYTDTEIFIDPCAGAGAFIDGCNRIGAASIGYDIQPMRWDINKRDLYARTRLFNWPVITNPPFSRNAATKVFNHIAKCKAPLIIMFWPASYRKWSRIDALDANYELLHNELFLGPQKFFEGPYEKDTMNMCIQVWERVSYKRPKAKPENITHIQDWVIRGQYGAPIPIDCALKFCYLGYSCGKLMAIKPGETFPKNTYHYLRADTPDWILNALRTQDWSCYYNNTGQLGSRSLSFTEINYTLDGLL
jgi:hypothetical protein